MSATVSQQGGMRQHLRTHTHRPAKAAPRSAAASAVVDEGLLAHLGFLREQILALGRLHQVTGDRAFDWVNDTWVPICGCMVPLPCPTRTKIDQLLAILGDVLPSAAGRAADVQQRAPAA